MTGITFSAQTRSRAGLASRRAANARGATTLFNNAVPPNGFMVSTNAATSWVNDHGVATIGTGFIFGEGGIGTTFVTPPASQWEWLA